MKNTTAAEAIVAILNTMGFASRMAPELGQGAVIVAGRAAGFEAQP
jgi:hypothetical protein